MGCLSNFLPFHGESSVPEEDFDRSWGRQSIQIGNHLSKHPSHRRNESLRSLAILIQSQNLSSISTYRAAIYYNCLFLVKITKWPRPGCDCICAQRRVLNHERQPQTMADPGRAERKAKARAVSGTASAVVAHQ